MKKTRTRFAPSPTGFLHIGSLRTALFVYLLAKSTGGDFILRIEDTDQKREVEGAAEKLLDILAWAGIEFDEGPGINEKFGPYIQSQRREIYDKYRDELLAAGKAYHCFCSPERLEAMRTEQQKAKQAPRYDRCCRDLDPKTVAERVKKGERFVIRQKMPLEGEVAVFDELRGEIKFDAKELEDHVLIKSNGMPTYQFANVVDDHLMEITHVARAEEWIPSFPKNILLYQDFGWEAPKFIHLPVVLNKEGGKLSKRQGDVAVEDYRDKGYLPEALINFCTLLGWHPKGDNEIFSLEDSIKEFDFKKINPSPGVFDIDKLEYFNGYYIRQKPLDELVGMCLPYLIDSGLIEKSAEKIIIKETAEVIGLDYLKKVIALEQERMKKLSEIGTLTSFFFVDTPKFEKDLLLWKKLGFSEIKINLEKVVELLEKIPEENWTNDSLEDGLMTYFKAKELKVGDYLWPMRVALSGQKASPSPFDIAETLGKSKSLKRLHNALTMCS